MDKRAADIHQQAQEPNYQENKSDGKKHSATSSRVNKAIVADLLVGQSIDQLMGQPWLKHYPLSPRGRAFGAAGLAKGGRVAIKVAASKDQVKTTVSDTGVGIIAKDLPKLFTKYYRVKDGLSTNSAGMGIGLFICKTIVGGHNGFIEVASVEGKGSTFSINLPTPTLAKLHPQKPKLSRSKRAQDSKNPVSRRRFLHQRYLRDYAR